jgi:hypothetical protein
LYAFNTDRKVLALGPAWATTASMKAISSGLSVANSGGAVIVDVVVFVVFVCAVLAKDPLAWAWAWALDVVAGLEARDEEAVREGEDVLRGLNMAGARLPSTRASVNANDLVSASRQVTSQRIA